MTGEIPPELGRLSNLTSLAFSRNRLTGEIPPELGRLSNLTGLFLWGNQLTGEIPPELGGLANLRRLFLNDNRLTGEIPPELGGLANLTRLELWENELTGAIPPELGRLSNLTYLWLRGNQLTGCIPEGLRDIASNDLGQLNLPDCGAATPMPTPTPTPMLLPNLVVDLPTVSLSSPMAGQSFTLNITVRNRGSGSSGPTAVSYYRSTDMTITSADTQVGADRVPRLDASGTSAESILTYAPSTTGTYYYGACVDSVSGESDKNCSAVVSATVSEFNLESLPWVTDGITGSERTAMDHIRALAQIDPSMSQRVAGSPWLSDGVSENELGMTADLHDLANTHPEVAVLVTTVPDETGRLMADILLSLRQILSSDPGRSEQFLSQSWFQDGLTEEEATLIVVLRPRRTSDDDFDSSDEEVYADLLQGGHVRSETISLPLAGEVDLFVVGRSELELEVTLERMAFASEAMEGFMGSPWPKPDVIVLLEFESDLGSRALGWNSYSHVVLKRVYKNLTYHELAHFYAVRPQWLSEGTADFLMSYTRNWTGDAISFDTVALNSLDRHFIARECAPHGAADIQGWIETMPRGTYCTYTLGKHFLAVIYRNLGHEVVSSALRELHEEAGPQGRVATEDEIYQAFLTNTPPSQRDEFRDLYHCLHGRPIPGYTAAPKAASSPEIRDALVALYNATNGPGWKNSGNWLTDAPLDQWHGVVTDCDGSLVGLILSENQLTGPIPPELGDLSALETLILSGNQLTGPIPPELGNLSELVWMILNENQLTGPIPPELGDLSGLQRLDLSSNQLTGEIPPELGRLFNLMGLDLSSNQLTGEIPSELGRLSNLTALFLTFNQLRGELPSELGRLSNLTRLALYSNQLTGEIPPELGRLSNLELLRLDGNQLTGEIPPELGRLSNLTQLALDSNQLTGEIPPELGRLSNLEWLQLHSNLLTGPIPPELGRLSELRSLLLFGNHLTGPIPQELGDLSGLQRLRLAGNEFTGCVPQGLAAVEFTDIYDLGLEVCEDS